MSKRRMRDARWNHVQSINAPTAPDYTDVTIRYLTLCRLYMEDLGEDTLHKQHAYRNIAKWAIHQQVHHGMLFPFDVCAGDWVLERYRLRSQKLHSGHREG